MRGETSPRKGGRRLLGIGLAVGVVALAAIGTSGSSASNSTTYGNGLKLGKVLSTAPIKRIVAPWLRWNEKKCSYETTTDHPAAYAANVRKIIGPVTIGYMDYGDTDPFGIANSRSVKAVAAQAGFKLNVYNLQYPSTTAPIADAKLSVLRHDKGVLQGNLDPTVLPGFFRILEGKGCTPSIALYGGTGDPRPSIGAIYADTGTLQGQYLAKQAKKRGYVPAQTAFVQCTDPTLSAFIAAMFPAAAKALTGSGFALPPANLFHLNCSGQSSANAVAAVKAWIEGHPNFKYLLFNAPDDERASGIIAALKAKGRLNTDSMNIGAGLDQLGQQQVRNGTETASIAFFPEDAGKYLIPMLEDVMAGNAIPQFVEQAIYVVDKSNLNKYYPAHH
jgi:ABC-type sugar transport system substrate-binding protein